MTTDRPGNPKAPCCGSTSPKEERSTPCCGGTTPSQKQELIAQTDDGIRAQVRARYGNAASGGGCCGGGEGGATLEELGYSVEDAALIPDGANLGLGCGNPVAIAALRPGDVVLDLGSGAGIDSFLASHKVGPTGQVIGVDMTPEMLSRARANAARAGIANVEFRLGEIENLPVADGVADAVISNCVVNLSPDKPRVFREACRALKPGGRMFLSDLVLLQPLPPERQHDLELYVGCVAGASLRDDYLRMIAEAGFEEVEVLAEDRYTAGAEALPPDDEKRSVFDAVSSLKVRARKPANAR